ncbi:MAG: hypothetical protein HRF45_09830 [Fimbriimonadia bacterium]|jgi:Spy/CpxP family protein refolding chaperone
MTRRLIVAAAVLAMALAVTAPGLAQAKKAPGPKPPDGMAQRKFDADTWLQMLTKHLDLTAKQQTAIKPILAKSIADMKKVGANTNLQPDAKRTQMQNIRQNTNAAIRKHLTAEQQKKFDQMGMRLRERAGGVGKAPGNKPSGKPTGKGA